MFHRRRLSEQEIRKDILNCDYGTILCQQQKVFPETENLPEPYSNTKVADEVSEIANGIDANKVSEISLVDAVSQVISIVARSARTMAADQVVGNDSRQDFRKSIVFLSRLICSLYLILKYIDGVALAIIMFVAIEVVDGYLASRQQRTRHEEVVIY